jgi:hypothetical protein
VTSAAEADLRGEVALAIRRASQTIRASPERCSSCVRCSPGTSSAVGMCPRGFRRRYSQPSVRPTCN